IGRRNYLPEPDIESVREHQRLAGTEVRLDIIAVEPRLTGGGSEDHDDPRLRCRIAYTGDGQSRGARGLTTPRVFTQADDDVDSAVSQVERVRVSLAAVADNRHSFPLEAADISVCIIEKFCHVFLRRLHRPVTTTAARCLRRLAVRVASELRAPWPSFPSASSRTRRAPWRARSSRRGGRACQSSRRQRPAESCR